MLPEDKLDCHTFGPSITRVMAEAGAHLRSAFWQANRPETAFRLFQR